MISWHRANRDTYLSVEVQCPAEDREPVLDRGVLNAVLVESIHGQFLLLL
jgi:hypothetical protein